jgi:hypothetical protein
MRRVAACVALTLLAGCKSDPEITGVRIVATFPVGMIDQLEFSLHVNGFEPDRDPIKLPVKAAGPLASPQDLVIHLPDRTAGQSGSCAVRGLIRGERSTIALPKPIEVVLHKVITCEVELLELPDGGTPPTDDAGVRFDVSLPGTDGPPADAALPRDLIPGVDVPPLDVAPPPDGFVPPDAAPDAPADSPLTPPPDAPADTAAVPVDTAPTPPDTMVVTGCAGGAARTAFLNPTQFPSVAGCGAALSYNAALGTGSAACAPGWHWCKAEEVGALAGGVQPGTVAGSTCGWVDGTQATCNDRRNSFPRAGCTGGGGMSLSVGGPPSGTLPCLTVDLGCMEPWKLGLAFDRWANTSVTGMGGGCLENLAFQCTSMAGGASCWITCCK